MPDLPEVIMPDNDFEVEVEGEEVASMPETPAAAAAPEPAVPAAPVPQVAVQEPSHEIAALPEQVRKLGESLAKIDTRLTERDTLEEKASAAWQKTQVQGQIDKKQQELADAFEKGETGRQAKLTTEISELAAKKSQLESRQEIPERRETPVVQQPVQQPHVFNPQAQAWIGTNRWFKHPQFQKESAWVSQADRMLAIEGYDPKTPEFFAELDKRTHEKFPHLKPAPAPGATNSGPAPVQQTRSEVATPKTPGKVRLTKEDLENMRNFNLDPSNKEHVREYALNKLGSAT